MKLKSIIRGLALALVLFFSFHTHSQAQQNWGIGLRLGDPSGLTLKKYMGSNALELNVGRTHWLYGNGWYQNRFDDWYVEQSFGYRDFQYWGYKSSTPLGVQLHYLFQKGIGRVAKESVSGLDWYFGFGAQFRFQTYRYDYRYKVEGNPNWFYETGGQVTDIDLGADGVIGLEYTFENAPISLFIDMNLFVELIDNPFWFQFQGGLGARYNF